jgi:hypothetical protein
MKQTVYFEDFRTAFHQMDRGEQFTPDGLFALFEYLEDFEQDTGEELELDVIALCCDFAEAWADEIAEYYNIETEADDTPEQVAEKVREFLEDAGAFVAEGAEEGERVSFVYRNF